jgi:hypothetical protein
MMEKVLLVGTRPGKYQFVGVTLFVLANLVMPLVFGELYPFTNASMFPDKPQLYCNYAVYDPNGRELFRSSISGLTWANSRMPSVDDFGLQRLYNGNLPGIGVGIKPPDTLDRFGTAPDQQTVTEHVARKLSRKPDLEFVDVVQEIVGPVTSNRVGVVQTNRWRVYRHADQK